MRAETRCTTLRDAYIAYEVVGKGPPDYVYVTGFFSHVDMPWEDPVTARALERFASFTRLIMFDRRGAGASDPVPLDALPTWEEWTEDLRAVLDAVGSERAAVAADLDGGPMAMLFAATYPERVSHLILWNTTARFTSAHDYPIGIAPEVAEATITTVQEQWGTEALVSFAAPSRAEDERFVRWGAKFMRAAATPRAVGAQLRYAYGLDARSILPLIRVPTLVMHRTGSQVPPIEQGRYLAEHIPGARFVEVPGADMYMVTESTNLILDNIEEFLTGARGGAQPDRVLATVLFTDIVGSTTRAAELGDRRWRELLDRHDDVARTHVDKFRGNLIKSTGDGMLATFDGPGKAIRCAFALGEGLRGSGIDIRAGLHTGEIDLRGEDVGGIAVHIASRVMSEAGPGEVVASRTVKDLVAGSEFRFEDRGAKQLKGVPDRWQLFAVQPC